MKNPIKLRIVFMGTSSFAATILKALIQAEHHIISVYTQKEKKSGRNQQITPSKVKLLAQKNNYSVFEPTEFNKETIEKLKEQKPDIIIVTAYGKILPKAVLDLPGFGVLNIHPSLLPRFRGPSPIQNAILENVTLSGTTIMLMDKEIDSGAILKQKQITLNPQETYQEILPKMAQISAQLLIETIPYWVKRKIKPIKQKEEEATYCQLIERSDGKIIWEETALNIYNKWRAFIVWPGIFTYWKVGDFNIRLKLEKISLMKKEKVVEVNYKLGQIFQLGDKIAVQAGDGAIVLEEIQLAGKNITAIKDFVNGHPNFINSILK